MLAVLENFQIKRLRNTPLGERLFIIFDVNKSGNIVENDFITGLTSLINDKDTRILCKFDPKPPIDGSPTSPSPPLLNSIITTIFRHF